jgi:hypothetical protein
LTSLEHITIIVTDIHDDDAVDTSTIHDDDAVEEAAP